MRKAIIYAHEGRSAQAQTELTKIEQFGWTTQQKLPALLPVYASLGRRDQCIALLQQAADQHSNAVTSMKVDPMYDPFRGDPRFQDVLRRVGLANTD